MRLLTLAALCSSFMYAGDLQEGDPKYLEVVLKLGTLVPHQLVEPFTEGERPHKDDIIAWKIEGVYKAVRVTKNEPNLLGWYHIQRTSDEKTCVSLTSLFKILTQAKSRL